MDIPTITKNISTLLVGMVRTPDLIVSTEVTSISMDSRGVNKGALFIATANDAKHRTLHFTEAIEKGAKVVLFDQLLPLSEKEIDCMALAKVQAIQVIDLSEKVSEIAARFFGHPSLALTIIAVTGTNGKTSVSHFIAQCLESSGHACGLIGTLGIGYLRGLTDSGMTTPNPVSIQANLAEFCHQKIIYVVIEASSHALEQGRLNSVAVDVAVLTNVSRDHLDYHKNMEAYQEAKKSLFYFQSLKAVVINMDDGFGVSLIDDLTSRKELAVITYSSELKDMTLQAKDIETSLKSIKFILANKSEVGQVECDVLGHFNIDNLLAVAGSLLAIKIPFKTVLNLINKCHDINGRMEMLSNHDKTDVVIDFAHTPDALEKTLMSLRHVMHKEGQLWCVFGCGGERDFGKRPLMGSIAEQYADRIVLTADNPRSESNKNIVAEILKGIKNKDKLHIEHDRKHAIAYAIKNAKHEDIILIAGKGHEQYQEIEGERHSFNDKEIALSALVTPNDERSMSIGFKK
jgi:UDP-N-acetylmuramoyl-L-alanyl-D-glutamate--2,6-diaminopimelate ligase|tara:strand:+ start:3891 stop:5441 length:1551 start_codon:yes stop_codon:yes gene_type:complete